MATCDDDGLQSMVDSERGRPGDSAATRLSRHLSWWLTTAAVMIGVAGHWLSDRTNWTGGYGYDGRFYGELATNWGSAVFSHGQVIPPGIGTYTGPHLVGVDSYYAFRIVPSGIVWLVSRTLGLSSTHGHVVFLFALLDAAMLGVVIYAWVASCDVLGLAAREKLLGALSLIVSFAVLRTGLYFPVLTDDTGLGLGALSMLLWLRGSTSGLVVCTVLGGFAWPTQLLLGGLLMVFPAPTDARGQLGAAPDRLDAISFRERWRPPPLGIAVGTLCAVGTVGALTYLQVRGYRSPEGTHQVPLFPLSVALVGVYVLAVVACLFPYGGARRLIAVARAVSPWRVGLAVIVIVGIRIAASAISHRGGYDSIALLKASVWATTLDPALFIVVLIAYFGPLILVVVADLPRVMRDAWRLGPAMVGVAAFGLLGALLEEPRKVIDTFPFLVLLGVRAARRMSLLSHRALLGILGLAFFLARPWLPIGNLSTNTATLSRFPAQLYYMSSGIGTSPESYWLQLAAVALVGAALMILARDR